MTKAPALINEMIYHSYAPSSVAEDILRKVHRKTILPAPDNNDMRDAGRLCLHLESNDVARRFKIEEITTPRDVTKAAKAGYSDFCPPAHTWGVVSLLMWLADQMREQAKTPITLRNLWRPQSYNEMVAKSGIESDHPNACGMDLGFQGSQACDRARDWLAEWVTTTDNAAQLSVGLGSSTMHVGVLSPKGTRHWTYKSWGNQPVPAVFTRMQWMNRP
jgi:hypothetical protein